MKKIAIFASGSGTNAINIINYFNFKRDCHNQPSNPDEIAQVKVVICNNPNAYVLTRAKEASVPAVLFSKQELTTAPEKLLALLESLEIDYIILAGYLLKIPETLIQKYDKAIINIHPALLPAYGGKGMYGEHVHKAVVAAKEAESGITIHLVDEKYDNGKILFQASCTLASDETAETLAGKIHILEQEHFPNVIEEYIKSR